MADTLIVPRSLVISAIATLFFAYVVWSGMLHLGEETQTSLAGLLVLVAVADLVIAGVLHSRQKGRKS